MDCCTYCHLECDASSHPECREEYARRLSAGLRVICGRPRPEPDSIQHEECGSAPYSGFG